MATFSACVFCATFVPFSFASRTACEPDSIPKHVTLHDIIRNDSAIIDLTLELRDKVLLGLVSGVASVALAVLFIRTFDGVDLDDPVAAAANRPVFELRPVL